MPDDSSNSRAQARGATIIAAGLLLAALALVVLYTSRSAFLSPLAMVVIAAIGMAALLLQTRMRPELATSRSPSRSPLLLNALGVVFAVAAVFADIFHFNASVVSIVALAALVSFAISAIIVLSGLRKRRV